MDLTGLRGARPAAVMLAWLAVAGCGADAPAAQGPVQQVDAGHADAPAPGLDAGPLARRDCAGGCVVAGECLADGASPAGQPCVVCDAGAAPAALVPADGRHCDDGAFCTVADACRGGACVGQPRDCSDELACTTGDVCDEARDSCAPGTSSCAAEQLCGASGCVTSCAGCVVGGVCVPAGARSTSGCSVCDPTWSTTALRPVDGLPCDDGAFCTTSDACAADVCTGVARDCSDSVSCSGVETCDESVDACVAGVSSCPPEQVCDAATDRCAPSCAGCLIGGVCVADGEQSPATPCEICDVARATDRYSPNDGGPCDDGWYCTLGDVCAGGVCRGLERDCSDRIACDGVETCDETHRTCAPGEPTCASGDTCDVVADACVATCDGCVVDGRCVPAGAEMPDVPCWVCDPARAVDRFSPNDGHDCDDERYCTVGDVCAAGVCVGAPRACDDGVACDGSEACDEGARACVGGTSTCDPGTVCDASADACVATCAGCEIDGVCFPDHTAAPGQPCSMCDVALDAHHWTAATDVECDDGLFCTESDRCVAGTCVGTPRACGDDVSCNGVDACDEEGRACISSVSPCAEGVELCDPVADACVPVGG